ncbi:MAG: hypothetical protein JNJ54_09220 [Myxococcaceae bacterium]|nr:hypothetical protein [Myxococcaceae bacterium]
MKTLLRVVVVALCACGGGVPGPGPAAGGGAGGLADGGAQGGGAAGGGAGGASGGVGGGAGGVAGGVAGGLAGGAAGGIAGGTGGGEADAGTDAGVGRGDPNWAFFPVSGTACALGAPAGIGYNAGATDELVVFLQGGGACWNNGMCQPSLYRWGPICNYGTDSFCLADIPGGTRPLAVYVSHPDPFPGDGGGAFSTELNQIKGSVFFARRPENPLRNASWAFVPYCTGDLHAGDATRTYFTKAGLFDMPVARTHRFHGARNLDAYLAWLRARHPSVGVVWLVGISGGGYGTNLNLHRVRAAFPEAQVHLLADSSPMIDSPYFDAMRREWNLQVPAACTTCDGGFPEVLEHQLASAPTSRVALLATDGDQVIARFFYSPGTTAGWATPPTAAYVNGLAQVLPTYDARATSKYFVRPGDDHVLLPGAGVVLVDGGVSASLSSRDGGVTLKAWLDAWATGVGTWQSQR